MLLQAVIDLKICEEIWEQFGSNQGDERALAVLLQALVCLGICEEICLLQSLVMHINHEKLLI